MKRKLNVQVVPPPTELDLPEFIGYLEELLIPDLEDSGRDGTAEDFRTCVAYLRELETLKKRSKP